MPRESGKVYLVGGPVDELDYYLEVGHSISANGIFISEYIEPHFNLGQNIPAMQLSNIPWLTPEEIPENNCLKIVDELQEVAFANDEIVVTDAIFLYPYNKRPHKISVDFIEHKYSLYVDFSRKILF
jgi:hypothetical protein